MCIDVCVDSVYGCAYRVRLSKVLSIFLYIIIYIKVLTMSHIYVYTAHRVRLCMCIESMYGCAYRVCVCMYVSRVCMDLCREREGGPPEREEEEEEEEEEKKEEELYLRLEARKRVKTE